MAHRPFTRRQQRENDRFLEALCRWRIGPRPVPLEKLRPRIIAKLNAWRRAEWHRERGTWRYPDENEGADG